MLKAKLKLRKGLELDNTISEIKRFEWVDGRIQVGIDIYASEVSKADGDDPIDSKELWFDDKNDAMLKEAYKLVKKNNDYKGATEV